jgi:hypothetical protein
MARARIGSQKYIYDAVSISDVCSIEWNIVRCVCLMNRNGCRRERRSLLQGIILLFSLSDLKKMGTSIPISVSLPMYIRVQRAPRRITMQISLHISKNNATVKWNFELMQFRVTKATNGLALTCCMYVSYTVGHEGARSILFQCIMSVTVTGGWRKLHYEELQNLHSSPSIIRMIKSRRMRWAGHVARMVARMNAYRILVGMPEGKRPLGSPRRRWVDNIKMDLRKIGWDGMDWSDLVQNRDHGEHDNEPTGSIKCWKVLEWLHNWRLFKKDSALWVRGWEF